MVVLHHDALERTLWGPASTAGRSRATDVAVYGQLVLVLLLGILCALDYDKPQAVRLAATAATLLVYFRSTELVSEQLYLLQGRESNVACIQFVRLLLFVSAVVLYGDVLVPLKHLVGAGEVLPVLTAKLVLHAVWIWNTLRLLYTIFKSGALKSGGQKKRHMLGAHRKRSKIA
ncbi:Sister chromatid cohesion protein 2 [Phytophthora boehmeriae]|uniref:Sister chromatid cohesion protein 2 n=1 Tax=Phytophthora boehmeriae TaxID=109152 RepID=A0A8T1X7Z1_9STRA|nr:Sister chromatid cohesion protein 2 [Phytophthora boehmeriae]